MRFPVSVRPLPPLLSPVLLNHPPGGIGNPLNLDRFLLAGHQALATRRESSLTLAMKKRRLGAFDGRFEVFGEAAIAIEPGDGALDDPSSRQRLEALAGVGAPDDVEGPGAKLGEGLAKLAAGIAAVGEDMS
jgi:hypothetical protein